MKNLRARPAIFLDRDGTVIQDSDPDYRLKNWGKKVKLTPKAVQALGDLKKLNLPIIIVTNQAWVARGVVTQKQLRKFHQDLRDRLKKYADVSAIYYCPHHPEADLKKYRLVCQCRKPNIGMFKQAAKDLNINLKKSVMVGDMTVDILAGRRAGCKTILLKTGYAGLDGRHKVKPHYTAKNLLEAASIIKDKILKL